MIIIGHPQKKAYAEDSANSRANYFDYSEGSAQTLDFSAILDFSEKGLPLDFEFSMLFGGNDYNYDQNGEPNGRAFPLMPKRITPTL